MKTTEGEMTLLTGLTLLSLMSMWSIKSPSQRTP